MSKSNILKLITNFPKILGYKTETLDEKINFFKELGYTEKDIIFMMERNTNLLLRDKQSILKTIKYYSEYIDLKAVLKMIKTNSNIINYKLEMIEKKKTNFIHLGYAESEFFKLLTKFPQLLDLEPSNIDNKINTYIKIGFTKEDIKQMSLILPSIFGYSIDNIYSKIIDIMNLGFSKEETINILKKTPQLFGYSIENIKAKVEYLYSINLKHLIVKDSNILIPSKDTTNARYNYLTEINSFAPKELYKKNKDFEKKYKITKEELIKRL